MVGETQLRLHDRLSLFALVHSLSKEVRVLVEEEEREARYQLLLTSCEDLHLIFGLFVVVVEHFDWAPNILLVLEDGGQGVRLVRASLAVINPLFNSLVFLPGVVTGECFDAGQVRATVKDLHLLVEDLQSLLRGLVLVSGCLDLFEEGFLANNVFVFFNNICMSRWQALDFKLFKIHQLENNI